MISTMLFSPIKATLKFLIERIESLFVDSVMIELDLNDDKSMFTKVMVLGLVIYHVSWSMTIGHL